MFSSFSLRFTHSNYDSDNRRLSFASYGHYPSYKQKVDEPNFTGTVTVGTSGDPSWFGTLDQDGNSKEWVEDVFTQFNFSNPSDHGKPRVMLGGGLGGFPFYRCSSCYMGERESIFYFNETLLISRTMNPSHIGTLSGTDPTTNVGDIYSNSSFRPVRTSAPSSGDTRWVEVAAMGNPGDFFKKYLEFEFFDVPHPVLGSVSYRYWIRRTPITISEWVSYLNTVDPNCQHADSRRYHTVGMRRNTITQELYDYWIYGNFINIDFSRPVGSRYFVARPNSGNKPACGMNWIHAARYCNWVTNGSLSSSNTEAGAYSLVDETESNVMSRANASVCAIPTMNEWYKAAYYNPSNGRYYRFSTRTDRLPQPCGVDQITENGIPEFTTRYIYAHFPEA
jgi:hypothetical protein